MTAADDAHASPTLAALLAVDEDRWARMPWTARQRWMHDSLTAMRAIHAQLKADAEELTASSRRVTEQRQVSTLDVIRAAKGIRAMLGPDPHGKKHLAAAERDALGWDRHARLATLTDSARRQTA